MNQWFAITDHNNSVAVSTRVRLARNLKEYPFPARMTALQKKELRDKVYASIFGGNSYISTLFYEQDPEDLSQNQLLSMMEQNLISLEFINAPKGKSLILSKDGKTSIMIGEEDHIRIQVIADSLSEAFDAADKLDIILGENLDMAYDARLGYLTQCPTNLGTAMRASVMLHLPALGETGAMARISANLTKLGITVRGTHGEGTQVQGHLYQISNQITLGLSEKEAIENLSSIAVQIIADEMNTREALIKDVTLRDKIFRALGILKYADQLGSSELAELGSLVQLGISLGLIRGIPSSDLFNEIASLQPATLTIRKSIVNPAQRDSERAGQIRAFLAPAKRME